MRFNPLQPGRAHTDRGKRIATEGLTPKKIKKNKGFKVKLLQKDFFNNSGRGPLPAPKIACLVFLTQDTEPAGGRRSLN